MHFDRHRQLVGLALDPRAAADDDDLFDTACAISHAVLPVHGDRDNGQHASKGKGTFHRARSPLDATANYAAHGIGGAASTAELMRIRRAAPSGLSGRDRLLSKVLDQPGSQGNVFFTG